MLGTAPSHLAFCTRATRTPPSRPKIEGRGDCRGASRLEVGLMLTGEAGEGHVCELRRIMA